MRLALSAPCGSSRESTASKYAVRNASRARTAFLEGYAGAADPGLLPAGSSAMEQLLAVFELEKAVYELRYEMNNRPDWVAIPAAAIRRLLEAA